MLKNYQQQISSTRNVNQQHKCLFDFQSINNIIILYQTFYIKENLVIDLDCIRQKGDNFLEYINEQLQNKDSQINEITKKSIQIFKVLIKQEYQVHSKIMQFQHLIEDKNVIIQNSKYSIKALQEKLSDRQSQIQKLKLQMSYLQQKFIQEQKKIKKQNKQIKRTFRQVQQSNEQQKQFFDSIQFQNEHLKIQFEQIKQQKTKLQQQISQLKTRQKQFLKQIQTNKILIDFQIKKQHSLQQEIFKNKTIIEKSQKQIDQLKVTLKNPFERIERINFDDKQYEEYLLYPKNKDNLVKLSQQIKDKQVYDISSDNFDNFYRRQGSLRKSFDQMSVSQNRQSFLQRNKDSFLEKDFQKLMPTADKQTNEQSNIKQQQFQKIQSNNSPKKLFMPDPYFAHFILTSQSVKIKEDCQQILNIDIKPFYKEIVEKRVPMHLWDQWIRNKLVQLVKKRQAFQQ